MNGGRRGGPRKSRKPRIHLSGTLGAPVKWIPGEGEWGHLESVYKTKFDDHLRADITDAAERYFYWSAFEKSAPFVNDVAKKLRSARKLANELQKAAVQFGSVAPLVARQWSRRLPGKHEEGIGEMSIRDDEGELIEDQKTALEDIFAAEAAPHHVFSSFRDVTFAIFSTLDESLRELKDRSAPQFVEGEAWDQMIDELDRAIDSHGLKVSASKGSTREISRFVRFVDELQSTFKEEFRRFSTDGSLSKEISRARRQRRRRAEQRA
jgi:hypothetical protein